MYATQSWPSNVNIFTKDVLERVYVEELDCDVYGASFTGNVARSDLLEGFTPVNSERLNFMVLHGEVGGGEYRSITEKQLSLCGMDYVALGHIHAQSGIRLAGKTAYAWPGCPQGRGFDECGEKGVYEGTVGKGKAEMHFMPLASKRYEIVRIPADGVTSNAELAARCRQLAQPDADVFMRFQLVGHVPMGLEINSSFLKEECEGFAELEIVDDTALEVEWESLKEERSLRGAFVQRLLPLLQSEDERTRRVAQMALRAGLSALEGEKVTL